MADSSTDYAREPRSPPPQRGRARSQSDGRRDGTPDFLSPRRRATDLSQIPSQVPTVNLEPVQSIRRRNTTRSVNRTSNPGLRPVITNQSRRSNFTFAGPEDTAALRAQHAPFVHPGYAELNPEYDQPANNKPVWGLAKPLPRVVRPGMVPTMSEVQEIRNQMPGENAHKEGVNVDPEDLEKGRVQPTVDPSKLSAQLKDARAQREHNFLQRHTGATRTNASRVDSLSEIGSRASARPPRRRSTWANVDQDVMSPPYEEEEEEQQFNPALDPIREGSQERPYVPEDDDGDMHSMTTVGGEELPDKELEPIVENIIEQEVHNHHTSWSVIRTTYREMLGEMLGVIIQLSVGYASDLAVTCADAGNPNTTAWAWGLSTMSAIYVSGGISGAHLNPAITIMLYIFRGFPKKKMPEYFIAQFLGAFLAAFIAYGLYYASIVEYLETNDTSGIINSFVTNNRETYIHTVTGFFNEFFGTAVLTVIILALGDDSNAPPGAGMNAFIVGLVVTMTSLAFAFQTGSALNPSRDFGPRLALYALGYGSELFTNPYWFYGPFAGAILGACVGATLYDVAIFTGGESPVNYPWTRTRRAAHKVHKRWKARFGKTTKEEQIGDRDAPL